MSIILHGHEGAAVAHAGYGLQERPALAGSGLLIDVEFLEGEGHACPFLGRARANGKRVERRKETAGEVEALMSDSSSAKASASALLSIFSSLLLYFSALPKNRGDWI